MVYYLFTCRSLTYAQRAERVLERVGITAHILRSPRSISGEGCSHAVKVSERRYPAALAQLKQAGLNPLRVYMTSGDGSFTEVKKS